MTTVSTKTNKRQKGKIEFTADNIDNTAPVKKILDELQSKNVQAYKFYCQNVKQRRTTRRALQNYHFAVPGYPLNAFDEDWDGELNANYFEAFPYKSFPPKMITELKNIHEIDPVTNYMQAKADWRCFCFNLKLTGNFTNMIEKFENLNEDVVQCPKHMVDVAAHLDSDPDPYFDSSYNWYYAGNGNMQLICIDWVDYLLHSVFTTVYLYQFHKDDLTIKSECTASFDCGPDNNILETICSPQNIIALRTKYKILILKIITASDTLMFEKIKCAESEMPYTGISFDNFHENILYITTLDNKLSIVNLDRLKARTVKLKGKFPSLVDNWNSVIGCGRGYYAHAGKSSITLYDKRSNDAVYLWNEVRNITDELGCNNISIARHLHGSNSVYFGTDHHLFMMDIRCYQKYKPKVVMRWTHGMECVPTYLSQCNFEFNKNLISLSSQWCEDMCVIPNYNCRTANEIDLGGVTIPYRPPNILSTLDEARQNMLCDDIYNPIDKRLCTSITGCHIIEQGDKYDILMQNSLGDISCHNLFPHHMESFLKDDSTQCLNDWSANYKIKRKDFEVSSIENIASIWKQLKKIPDDFKIDEHLVNSNSKFSEQEIVDVFENEEIDSGLQEVWIKGTNEITVDQSSLALNLHLSDEEDNSTQIS